MASTETVINRSQRRTKHIGFMFSCRLNGIINSQIARGVMQTRHGYHPQQKEYTSEAYMRMTFFSDITQKIADKNNFLLGVAFAQYYINGYGNVLYPPAFLFSKEVKDAMKPYFQRAADQVLGLQVLSAVFSAPSGTTLVSSLIKTVQQEITDGLEELLSYATHVTPQEKEKEDKQRVVKQKDEIDNRQKYPYSDSGILYTTPKQAVIAGVSLVERVNPLHNACVRQKLMERDASLEKVAIVLDASKHFSYPDIFIAAVETAQQTAVIADTVGITLFEYLTPKVRRNAAFQQFIEEAKEHYKEKLK